MEWKHVKKPVYCGFGLACYTYVKRAHEEGHVIVTGKHKREKLRRTACGSRDLIPERCTPRRFSMAPIVSKVISLDLDIHRVACRRCAAIRQVELSLADSRLSYTRAFGRYVLELWKHTAIPDMARHLYVSWDVIIVIQKSTYGGHTRSETWSSLGCRSRAFMRRSTLWLDEPFLAREGGF